MKFLPKEHKKGKAGHEHEEEEPYHPGEVDPLVFAGVRLHGLETKDTFARVTIFLIALTAVFSALSAFSYSRTSTAANEAAPDALEHQVEEYQARLQAARQRLQLAQEGMPAAAAGDPADDMKMIAQMMTEQDKDHSIQDWLKGEDGPELDPRYPEKFVTRITERKSHEEFGMWDAKNELSLGWRKKANTMLATITLFAIALYLFGQSLGMGKTRAAFILVFLSTSLVVIRSGRAVLVRFAPLPRRAHTQAAECKDPDEKSGQADPAGDAAKH